VADILNIGRRIELIPMDPHFHEISIGLYQQEGDTPKFIVHSYTSKAGADDRISFIRQAMVSLGGMTEDGDYLSFPCGHEHHAAVRRAFLEAGKLSPDAGLEPKPLSTLDRKSGLTLVVSSKGSGLYEVTAEGEGKNPDRRIKVAANGLAKLGEMHLVDGRDDQVQYPCSQDHDALTGLLLVRAPNVRAIVREEEMASSRGVLAAPSKQ
jgi:hypothetical protein